MNVIASIVFFAAVLLMPGQAAYAEESDMKIPPIDLKQPAHLETATFALG